MCDSSCSSRSCLCLEVLIGLIAGVIAALLFWFMPSLYFGATIFFMFGLAVLAAIGMACVLGHLTRDRNAQHICLCGCAKPTLFAIVGTIAVGLVLMLFPLSPTILTAILIALYFAFFAAMMVGILWIFLCIIQKLCCRPRPCRECDDEDDEDFRR
ncbi:hypothetical protein [Pygmaiobacter massiliensis]|uniref:hypothetical protein n=1 Tax=Pygmaiobacter massiliensis TaxID=1917873 RepID=UPI002A831B8A|nr:hypothetical protein [Pygmaiobacter massiliensis]MDY4784196.1 hypothetical protein [Pygmaiobacter massiliensis]